MTLETELLAYRRLRPTLLDRTGAFALVSGDCLLGVYETYDEALSAGYRKVGLRPFLVKRIAVGEDTCFMCCDIVA